MTRTVRKQVNIEPRQEEFLKRRAREIGVSEAKLIRRGIDRVASAGRALPPDLQAWEEAKAFIEQHRRMEVPQTGRGWTRDELYRSGL